MENERFRTRPRNRRNNIRIVKMFSFEKLKRDVLAWLDSIRVPGSCCRYKFHANADDTIFCSCFALFILDLFRETEKFTTEERNRWISYIQNFQNEQQGYFEPKTLHHHDEERNRYQLTCFCLSAMGILGGRPKYPLAFLGQWKSCDDIRTYLYEKGIHKGRPGSGNKAMFLAIFLTYEYERTREEHLLDKMNTWFEVHDNAQNRNGFWGEDLRSHYLHGLQNGFHQFIIYFYWQRRIPKLENIVDIALLSQDRYGFFAPTPGGDACHDYDAVHVLSMAHMTTDYRKEEIESCLKKASDALLSTQNGDGGFCQSKCSLVSLGDFFKYVPFYFSGRMPYLWYYRSRVSLGAVLKKRSTIQTGWTEKPRFWSESNLWDTWFRCLALAEIAHIIGKSKLEDFGKGRFLKVPGLGNFI